MSRPEPTRPRIDYPTRWQYKMIGRAREDLEAAARRAAGHREHTIEISRRSHSQKYVSMTLEVEVGDEAARLEVFAALKGDDAVLFVL